MVNSFSVKTKRRIEALMMIMTLCLLVYNFAQYRVRKTLEETNETLPNQVGTPIQNPTLKWIFQIMEGIAIIQTVSPLYGTIFKAVVARSVATKQSSGLTDANDYISFSYRSSQ